MTSSEVKEYYSLTKRAFDTLAPVYDVITLPLVGVREKAVDFTNADKGSKVLDVATGTGRQAFAFAKRGYDVTGVDITESMLEIARKHNKNGLVKFEVADGTQLRFEARSFDVACVSFALHDMPLVIREKVLKEMVRVIKIDGVIIIVDYDLPRNKIGRALIYHLIALYEGQYYREFMGSDLETLLAETGITVIEMLPILLGAGRILRARISALEPPTKQ